MLLFSELSLEGVNHISLVADGSSRSRTASAIHQAGTAEAHCLFYLVARQSRATMKQPEDVQLSPEEGEALIERIERNALSAEDRRLLVKRALPVALLDIR